MDVKSVKKKTQSVVYMSKLILECLFSADVGIGIFFFFWLNTQYWDLISYCGVAGCWVLLGILCLENKKVQEF